MEDRVGLDKAYNLDSGSYVSGDTLFVAGTKSLRDVWDDLKIPFGLTSWSDRYQQADRVLEASPQVRRVVGHSLGGAVALELAQNHPRLKQTETYGAPVFSFEGSSQRHRHWLDPVAMLDSGADTTVPQGLNPHSYQALAKRTVSGGSPVGGSVGASAVVSPPLSVARKKKLEI
jgi:pimeloyl-ACP methyl ester carboxylesterase